VDAVPDFGPGVQDGSSLDGLSGVGVNGQEPPSDRAFEDLAAAIRALAERVDQLEEGTRAPGTLPVIGGGFPERGLDGGWAQQPQVSGLVQGLPERFTLQFPEGSAALSLSTEYGLNALIEWMFAYPSLRVLVTGHSDATGNARTNMELSRRRAQVVRYYLLERGVPMERVNAAHFGEGRPEWGGAFDRRVEVTLTMD
jgi:outer membrane protein OmpA-like peptidoglycan-associated protein